MANDDMRQQMRICKHCDIQFAVTAGNGRYPDYCGAQCRSAAREARRLPKTSWPICSSDDCNRKVRHQQATKCSHCYSIEARRNAGKCIVPKCKQAANRVGHGLCEVHYYRLRRTGDTELTPRTELTLASEYKLVKAPDHPNTSRSNGWAYEHRIVAYEKYGEGPHPCHWCGNVLDWKSLVVDHLNDKKHDNRKDNLVVACTKCNRLRGSMIPFIKGLQPHRVQELIDTFKFMRCEAAE